MLNFKHIKRCIVTDNIDVSNFQMIGNHTYSSIMWQSTSSGISETKDDTSTSQFGDSSQKTVGVALSHIPGLVDTKTNTLDHLSRMYIASLLRNSNSNNYASGERFFPIMIRSLNFYPSGYKNSSFEQAFKEEFITNFINVMTQNDLLTDQWKETPYTARIPLITGKTMNYLDCGMSLFLIVFVLQELEIYSKTNSLNSETNNLLKDLINSSEFKNILRLAKLNIKNKPLPPRLVDEIHRLYGFRSLKTDSGDSIVYCFVPTFVYPANVVDSDNNEKLTNIVVKFPFECKVEEIINLVNFLINVINNDDSQKIAQNLNIIYDRKWIVNSFQRVPAIIPSPNLDYITFWLNTPIVCMKDDDLLVSHTIEKLGGSISLQSPGGRITPINFINTFVKVNSSRLSEPKFLGGLFVPSPNFNTRCDTGNLPPFHTKIWKYNTGLTQIVHIEDQIATQSRYIVKLIKLSDVNKQIDDSLSTNDEKSKQKSDELKGSIEFGRNIKYKIIFDQINDHLYLHKTTDVLRLTYTMRDHVSYLYDIKSLNSYSMKVNGVRLPLNF